MLLLRFLNRNSWIVKRSPWHWLWSTYNETLVVAFDRQQQRKTIENVGEFGEFDLGGILLSLDLRYLHDFRMYRRINELGSYEPETTRFIQHRLKFGMTFVDIGANNGYFTLIAARQVGANGQVYSFEPSPNPFLRLRNNVDSNHLKQVRTFNLAVADYFGYAVIQQSETDDSHSTLGTKPLSNATYYTVKAISLDAILKEVRVDMVKIDAEGSEQKILEGMREVVSNNLHMDIIMEWNSNYHTLGFAEMLCRNYDAYYLSATEHSTNLSNFELIKVRSFEELPLVCNIVLRPKSTA